MNDKDTKMTGDINKKKEQEEMMSRMSPNASEFAKDLWAFGCKISKIGRENERI